MERIINEILETMSGVKKPQQKFIVTLFLTIMLMRGKVNFRNLSRYSDLCEKSYSRQFRQPFDFPAFNQQLIKQAIPVSHKMIVAMDCTFESKSGKQTYGLGNFYDSCHSQPAKGLELSTLAIVDVTVNTAYALSCWQTPPQKEIEQLMAEFRQRPDIQAKMALKPSRGKVKPDEPDSRIDFYALHLRREVEAKRLPPEAKHVATDGYYTKKKFTDTVIDLGLEQIGHLRHDANMRYLFDGEQKPRGAPRKYDGKVHFDTLSRLEKVTEVQPGITLYTAVVNHVSLERNIRLVYLLDQREPTKPKEALLFSTDIQLSGLDIYYYYKARFQIEFIFRDAKQFTGLGDAQVCRQDSLAFHFNASLTVLNLAKLEQAQADGNSQDRPFSMASSKIVHFNQHFITKIFSILDLDLTLINSHPNIEALTTYGAIST